MGLILLLSPTAPHATDAASRHIVTTGAANAAAAGLEPIGQVGGITYAVATFGELAYVGSGARIGVYDLSIPSLPRKVGESDVLSGVVRDFEAHGPLGAASVGEGGIDLLDLSSPAAPRAAGRLAVAGETTGIAVGGRIVCAGVDGDEASVWVIDAADPAAPRVVSEIPLPGKAYALALEGARLHFLVEEAGLRIYDLTAPASPVELGRVALADNQGGATGGMTLDGGFALVADGANGFWVADVRNPAAPTVSARVVETDNARDVVLSAGYAYVADGQGGLAAIDVSSPARPWLVGRLATSGPAVGAAAGGDLVVVADEIGARVVDTRDPVAPKLAADIDGPAYVTGIALSGGTAFAYDAARSRLWSVDVRTPERARLVGRADAVRPGREGEQVRIAGGHAFVANGSDGLLVFDVRTPADPRGVGAFTDRPAFGLAVSGRHVSLASGDEGLQIVDVLDPARPVAAGTFQTAEYATSVFAEDGRTLVLAGERLEIVDAGNPGAAHLLGSYAVPPDVSDGDVVSAVGVAYVATDRLEIVDLDPPSMPERLGMWQPEDDPLVSPRLALNGATAVVVDYGANRIWAVDVSSPTAPDTLAAAALPSGGGPIDLAAAPAADGTVVAVAMGEAGVMLYRLRGAPGPMVGRALLPYAYRHR